MFTCIGANAAIVCYDPLIHSTYEKLKFWIDDLKVHTESAKIYICATKIDLVQHGRERQVDPFDVKDLADENNAKLFETSSKTGENVKELFYAIAQDFLEEQVIAAFKVTEDEPKSEPKPEPAEPEPTRKEANNSNMDDAVKPKCCIIL